MQQHDHCTLDLKLKFKNMLIFNHPSLPENIFIFTWAEVLQLTQKILKPILVSTLGSELTLSHTMAAKFCKFYQRLYNFISAQMPANSSEAFQAAVSYIKISSMPSLFSESSLRLESSISPEKLELAIKQTHTGKVLALDIFFLKYYTHFQSLLLP